MRWIFAWIIAVFILESISAVEIHRWQMNETSGNIAYDSIGGVNGVLNGGASFSGGAATFDGVNDYVALNSVIRLHDTQDWTISLFYKGTDASDYVTYGSSLIGVNSSDWWGLITLMNGKAKYLHATSNGYHPTWDNLVGTTSVIDNQWHNIVIRNHSNATADIFVDGNLEVSGSSLLDGTPSQDVMSMRLEYFMLGSPDQYTSGSIKDIRVFSHSISTAELNMIACVPEPSTWLCLMLPIVAAFFRRFKK